MILVITLLFSTIIIALLFKYYIFKYQYFKYKILEGNTTNGITGDTASSGAAMTNTLENTINEFETKIFNLRKEISKLMAEWDENKLTIEEKESKLNELSGDLTRILSEYEILKASYNEVLENRSNEIKIQLGILQNAITTKNQLNDQIQKLDNANTNIFTSVQKAKDYSNEANNAKSNANSYACAKDKDIDTVTNEYNKVKNFSTNMIDLNKTIEDNYKIIVDAKQNTTNPDTTYYYMATEQKYFFNTLNNKFPSYITDANNSLTLATYVNKIKTAYNEVKTIGDTVNNYVNELSNLSYNTTQYTNIENKIKPYLTSLENLYKTATNDLVYTNGCRTANDYYIDISSTILSANTAFNTKTANSKLNYENEFIKTKYILFTNLTLYYKFGSDTIFNGNSASCRNEQNTGDLTINIPFTNAVRVNKTNYVKTMTDAAIQFTGNNWAITCLNYPNLIYSSAGISFMGWYYSNHTQQQSFNGCDVRIIGISSKSILIYLTIDANSGFGLNIFVSSYSDNKWNAQNKYVYTDFVNKWTHVAITYIGTTLYFYHNGVVITKLTVSASSEGDTFQIKSVGDFQPLQTHLYTGDILRFNEFYFFNRTIDKSEILHYYTNTKDLVTNILTKPSKSQFNATSVPRSQNNTIQVPYINKENYVYYSNRLFNSNISFSIYFDDDFDLPYTTYWYNSSDYNGSVTFYYNNNVLSTIQNVRSCQYTEYVNQIVISNNTTAGCVINYIEIAKVPYG